MGRFAMRWPGHNQFWDVMAELGFLDETRTRIGNAEISPRRFVLEHLTPRLQFRIASGTWSSFAWRPGD